MNNYARQMIMRRQSERRGDDRDMRDMRYMRDGGSGEYRGNFEGMYQSDHAMYDREMEDGRRGVRGTGKYGIGGSEYYRRDRDMRDYDERDMRGYDMRGYDRDMRDYADMDMGRFTEREMEMWKREMKNADGSMGEHFSKEQVEQTAQKIGVNPAEFGKGVFCMAMNMMFSDYVGVARRHGVDKPEFYADMAKAFLDDKDYRGMPEEKLYTYYKCIAEK